MKYALVAVLLVAPAFAGEGLKVGDRVGAYYVVDVTGPSQGEKLCYRCQYGNEPVVNVFTRKMDDNVAKLIAVVEEEVAEHEMKGFVTLLADESDSNKEMLQKVASEKQIKNVPLTISADGPIGPTNYKLTDAEVTVLMWKEGKVVSTHTFSAADLNADAIKKVENELHTKLGS